MPDEINPMYGGQLGGSLSDLVSNVKNIVTNIGQLTASRRNINTFTIGTTISVNTLGTTSAQVISADSTRTYIMFHNPSDTVTVLVRQNATATFSSRGGAFIVLPMSYVEFSGSIQLAWNAAAQTGASNPLTVTSFS